MKNQTTKTALYHAWGKTPVLKKREKEYNANYYQRNKDKWGVKKDFIGPLPRIKGTIENALDKAIPYIPFVGALGSTSYQVKNYLVKDLPKTISKTVSKILNPLKEKIKNIKVYGENTVETIHKENNQIIEEGIKYVKNLLNSIF